MHQSDIFVFICSFTADRMRKKNNQTIRLCTFQIFNNFYSSFRGNKVIIMLY